MIKANTPNAYVLSHGNTWDWICRHCMNEGNPTVMNAYTKMDSSVWLECSRCGAKERIDLSLKYFGSPHKEGNYP